jgi:ABC-type branched-subunit amino acid transport system ATPase component
MSEGAAPLLAVAGLCSGYGPVQVLYGIDLEIHRGEVVALLGPNGAGKTTLLRTIAGQIPPAAGTITVNGRLRSGSSVRASSSSTKAGRSFRPSR